MEFEAGESIIAPEMYESYGYAPDSRPSDLHGNRAKDKDGNFIGFASERRFSENAMAIIDKTEEELSWKLVPLDLHLDGDSTQARPSGSCRAGSSRKMAAHLQKISEKYGTKFTYDETDGTIRVK